jgi:NADH:ubiquinone oxidoreductase subunit H
MRWGLFFVAEYANMFLVSAIAVTCFLGGWQPSRSNTLFAAVALFFTFLLGIKSISYFVQLVTKLIAGRSLFDLLGNIRPVRFTKPMFIGLALVSLAGGFAMQLIADFWLVTFLLFVAKVYAFVFVIIWIRWTLPRIRIDQMMDLCWKKLVPLGFGCIAYAAMFMLLLRG